MQELKTMKLGHGYMEPGIMPLSMVSTGDSSSIPKQQLGAWGKNLSLWGIPPTSPCSTTSMRNAFQQSSSHSTSSKESLWTSTQSSPISHPLGTNLWESPVSKLSQATLMSSGSSSSKDSVNSIWFTPPQIHSPNAMVTSTPNGKATCDVWDVLRTPPVQKNGDTIPRLVRPQEISNTNGWISDLSKSSKDSVSSLWATPTTPPANTYTGATYAPNSSGKMLLQTDTYAAKRLTPPTMQPLMNDSQNAANSCLQLFSDEFLNYLNMIN
uniref:Uncharacterized protein n=2 Tax=Lutzomyia longipalpis TaxID=7200 RepID=A0A1B0CX80_LUTLO